MFKTNCLWGFLLQFVRTILSQGINTPSVSNQGFVVCFGGFCLFVYFFGVFFQFVKTILFQGLNTQTKCFWVFFTVCKDHFITGWINASNVSNQVFVGFFFSFCSL